MVFERIINLSEMYFLYPRFYASCKCGIFLIALNKILLIAKNEFESINYVYDHLYTNILTFIEYIKYFATLMYIWLIKCWSIYQRIYIWGKVYFPRCNNKLQHRVHIARIIVSTVVVYLFSSGYLRVQSMVLYTNTTHTHT